MRYKCKWTVQPCEQCGWNKWKTKKKGQAWACRNCGHVRVAGEEVV